MGRGACWAEGEHVGWWGGQCARRGAAPAGTPCVLRSLPGGLDSCQHFPSKSESERQEHRKLCSRVVPPRGTRGPGGACLLRASRSQPRLLNGPQGRPACSQRRPSRPHPHCLSWLLRTLYPSGVLQEFTGDVYALSKGDLSRGTGVFGLWPCSRLRCELLRAELRCGPDALVGAGGDQVR